MRAFVRTSRRTGVSMPLWAGLIVGAVYLVVMLAVLFYGLIAMGLVLLVRLGVRGWVAWRDR